MRFTFAAEVWLWDARVDSSWYFLSLPEGASEEIREIPRMPRGFGSVRVEVAIGASTWRTSIFPDAARAAYVLPLKAAVRRAEGIEEGDVISVEVVLRDA